MPLTFDQKEFDEAAKPLLDSQNQLEEQMRFLRAHFFWKPFRVLVPANVGTILSGRGIIRCITPSNALAFSFNATDGNGGESLGQFNIFANSEPFLTYNVFYHGIYITASTNQCLLSGQLFGDLK